MKPITAAYIIAKLVTAKRNGRNIKIEITVVNGSIVVNEIDDNGYRTVINEVNK